MGGLTAHVNGEQPPHPCPTRAVRRRPESGRAAAASGAHGCPQWSSHAIRRRRGRCANAQQALTSLTPRFADHLSHLAALRAAALRAVDPAAAVRRSLTPADFADAERVFIVGAGKA